ncbi:MAG: Dabb family protein [Segetibacter sp.]|nr:Dabb family protein [Segetibacter sp.]
MKKQTRRNFLATTGILGGGLAASAMPSGKGRDKKQVIHHVFFWLKNPNSKEDLDKLLAGLQTLKNIETVRAIHIGVSAKTEQRSVVDASFSASELLFFDDLAGQKTYQDHPIHLEFVKNCSALWEKVIVYDSIDI